MGQFDPIELLNKTATGQLLTKRPPIPEGMWEMTVEKLSPGTGVVQGQPDPATGLDRVYYYVDFELSCQEPEVLEETGLREKAFIRQHRVFLDFDEDTGELSEDNNLTLGQMMEAAGINEGGRPISDLEGCSFQVRVGHRPNPKDPNAPPYAEARGFAPLS